MTKYAAFGTQLQMGDGATPTEAFTTVAHLQTIGGPDLSTDTVDVTAHDSPGGYEEFVATIKRSGEVSMTVIYDPADATHDATTGLLKAYNDRTLKNWKLIFPDVGGSVMTFAGYVTGFAPSAPFDEALTAEATIKVTGLVTLI